MFDVAVAGIAELLVDLGRLGVNFGTQSIAVYMKTILYNVMGSILQR